MQLAVVGSFGAVGGDVPEPGVVPVESVIGDKPGECFAVERHAFEGGIDFISDAFGSEPAFGGPGEWRLCPVIARVMVSFVFDVIDVANEEDVLCAAGVQGGEMLLDEYAGAGSNCVEPVLFMTKHKTCAELLPENWLQGFLPANFELTQNIQRDEAVGGCRIGGDGSVAEIANKIQRLLPTAAKSFDGLAPAGHTICDIGDDWFDRNVETPPVVDKQRVGVH